MNNKYQSGLIIYRKNRSEFVHRIILRLLTSYELEQEGSLGHTGQAGKNDKYEIFQIRKDCFRNYSEFDSFLIELGQILDDIDNIGLVIGHTDEIGFMWLDYNNFAIESDRVKQIKEEIKKEFEEYKIGANEKNYSQGAI